MRSIQQTMFTFLKSNENNKLQICQTIRNKRVGNKNIAKLAYLSFLSCGHLYLRLTYICFGGGVWPLRLELWEEILVATDCAFFSSMFEVREWHRSNEVEEGPIFYLPVHLCFLSCSHWIREKLVVPVAIGPCLFQLAL